MVIERERERERLRISKAGQSSKMTRVAGVIVTVRSGRVAVEGERSIVLDRVVVFVEGNINSTINVARKKRMKKERGVEVKVRSTACMTWRELQAASAARALCRAPPKIRDPTLKFELDRSASE